MYVCVMSCVGCQGWGMGDKTDDSSVSILPRQSDQIACYCNIGTRVLTCDPRVPRRGTRVHVYTCTRVHVPVLEYTVRTQVCNLRKTRMRRLVHVYTGIPVRVHSS